MTLEQTNKLDGAAVAEDGTLILLLTDAMGWDDEASHIMLLQEKLNAYAAFVESKQYKSIYPDKDIQGFIIEIHFSEKITENCLKFLEAVASQLGDSLGITISVDIDDE